MFSEVRREGNEVLLIRRQRDDVSQPEGNNKISSGGRPVRQRGGRRKNRGWDFCREEKDKQKNSILRRTVKSGTVRRKKKLRKDHRRRGYRSVQTEGGAFR